MKKSNFRTKTFLVSTIVFSLLTFATLMCAGAEDEGTGNIISAVFSKLFYLFRFPTHTLFWTTFNHGPSFIWGLLINSVFYGLIAERVISIMRQRKQSNGQAT